MKTFDEGIITDLLTLTQACAARFGTKTAFRDKTDGVYQGISYARVLNEVQALALMLQKRYVKGDRVLILGKNSYRWVLSFLAMTWLGVVPVPVDPAMRATDLAAIAARSGAKGVLYAPEARSKRRALVGLTAVCFDKYPALLAEGKRRVASGENARCRAVDPGSTAVLLFTPGTTGTAKGVKLSHSNLLFVVSQIPEMLHVGREDVFLSVLPLSHAYELVCGLLLPLYCGATVAFGEGLSHLLSNMREIHPTCMVTIPYLAQALYSKCWQHIAAKGREAHVRRMIAVSDPVRPLAVRQAMKERLLATERAWFGGSLRRLLILGGSMDAAVQKGLRQLGVFAVQGYGVTECAGLAALSCDDRYRDGSAGVAFSEGMLDIYNAQPDGSGEIRYRGWNVMQGYLDAQRSAAVLRDGWYYTGDIGRIDADGFLYVLGRRCNCIETMRGYLICPEELERLLRQSPFVRDAAVIGYWDEQSHDSVPVALLLPDHDAAAEAFAKDTQADGNLDGVLADWVATVNAALAPYQRISRTLLCTAPFPRDAAGRIRRAAVAQQYTPVLQQQE